MKDALTKYAKVSRCVVRTKGLFLKASGCDSAAPLDVSYDDDGLIYGFSGPQQLTDKDLEVLLALIAIATAQNDSFQTSVQFGGQSPKHRGRRQLTAKVGLSTSYSALSREMARSVGGTLGHSSLKRLQSCVTFESVCDSQTVKGRMM